MSKEWLINDIDNSMFIGVKVILKSIEKKVDNTLVIDLDVYPVSRNVIHIGCCFSICFVNGFIARVGGTVVPDFVRDYTLNILYKNYNEIRRRALEEFKPPVDINTILSDYRKNRKW